MADDLDQTQLQSPSDCEGFFLRVRGLPWTATKDDISKFFNDSKIVNDADGIHMTLARGGRPSGECYIEFDSEEDLNTAFKKHKHTMGHRYVEIFKSERSEMEWVCRKNYPSNDSNATGFVWLRGIPFGCSKEEIAQFFAGLKIVPNGITLPVDDTGRSTGEAFVQFASKEIAEKAMGKHKEKIGHRYIEIFQSSLQEVRNATQKSNPRMRSMMGGGRPGPYSRNDRYGDGGNMGGRYGGGGDGGGGGRGGMGRSRNMKSFYDDDDMYNDYGDDYGGGYMDRGGRFSGGGGSGGSGGGGRQNMGGPNRSGGFGGEGGGRGRGGGGSIGGGSGGGGDRGGRRNDFNGGMRGGRGMNDAQNPNHMVHMRGLPFRATEQDVADFFSPIPIADIFVKYGTDGRASGKADVVFYNHQDAVKAMTKDKQNMQHRYVELFLQSETEDMDGGGFNCGGGPGGNMEDDQGMGNMGDDYGNDNGGGYGGFQGGGGGGRGGGRGRGGGSSGGRGGGDGGGRGGLDIGGRGGVDSGEGRRMMPQDDYDDGNNQYGGGAVAGDDDDDVGYGNMGGGNMGGNMSNMGSSGNGYRGSGNNYSGNNNSMYGGGGGGGGVGGGSGGGGKNSNFFYFIGLSNLDDGYRTNSGQDQSWNSGQQTPNVPRQPPVNSNTTRRMSNVGGGGSSMGGMSGGMGGGGGGGIMSGGGMGSGTGMSGGMGGGGGYDRGYRTSSNQGGYTEF
ncbi:Heterogeneous nuclear ribonucleoprotein H2 [Nymphon striatum]|nr:Heterogeneous nuclear ribonucleoprotein H2 [Nymphon striatum]